MISWAKRSLAYLVVAAAALATGCRQDMYNQPRYDPLEASDFFPDGVAARPIVSRTIPRGFLRADTMLYTGTDESEDWATVFPFPITRSVLERGRERYDIYCSPCHDRTGSSHGVVVSAGYPQPATLHDEHLIELPEGVLFDNISNGFGKMPSLGPLIPPRDRWAIVAYVRALQLSQHATFAELPASDQVRVLESEHDLSAEETVP